MTDADDNTRHSWYVRHSGRISGPFLNGHIKREILLGHFKDDDEISHDQKAWVPIGSHAELVPEILNADSEDPLVKDRLAAARRWADDSDQSSGSLLSRQPVFDPLHPGETYLDDGDHASVLEEKLKQTRHDRWQNNLITLLILSVIAALIYFYFSGTEPVTDTPVDCSARPARGVNLSNCFLQGVSYAGMDISEAVLMNTNLTGADLRAVKLNHTDMSYSIFSLADLEGAELQGAKLVGSDFNAANLMNADLTDADLSYSNLYAADINGAELNGAKLDLARWIDGRICKIGSIGTCR